MDVKDKNTYGKFSKLSILGMSITPCIYFYLNDVVHSVFSLSGISFVLSKLR